MIICQHVLDLSCCSCLHLESYRGKDEQSCWRLANKDGWWKLKDKKKLVDVQCGPCRKFSKEFVKALDRMNFGKE